MVEIIETDGRKAHNAMIAVLTTRRRKLGLSREALDELLRLPAGSVARFEDGKRRAPLPVLVLWAHVVGLRVRIAATGRLPRVTVSAIEQRGELARRMAARASGEAAA